jgi:DNA invertase Pin-like site-specific DNA recombinase
MSMPNAAIDEGRVPTDTKRVRAAQYVRMSTDHQRYSIENQIDALSAYARANDLEIVKTYADAGRSGLTIRGRAGLQKLLADVQAGDPGFEALLVYDVSRWGRFQDADESAHYEFLCRSAGVRMVYVTEPFDNDGSPLATIVKSLKRLMAGEYSRELGRKVFLGQSRLARKGFRQGSMPPYALCRRVVSEDGKFKQRLRFGERKGLATDRVILVPGADKEVRIVRRIYRLFAEKGMYTTQIAALLNAEGIKGLSGTLWWAGSVGRVLDNPAYAGEYVFNRTSSKLTPGWSTPNPPELWIRSTDAFVPIIHRELFDRTQAIRAGRRHRPFTDEQIIDGLRALKERTGRITCMLIEADKELPSCNVIYHRFGSLIAAYGQAGFFPDGEHATAARGKWRSDQLRDRILREIEEGLTLRGLAVERLSVRTLKAGATTLAVNVLPSSKRNGLRRWRTWSHIPTVDLNVLARTTAGNDAILDYYLVPPGELAPHGFVMGLMHARRLAWYRTDTLAPLFERLAARPPS